MSPPFSVGLGEGGWTSYQIFKTGGGGGLTGPPFLEGSCWERGGDLFQGEGCNFYIKNKVKPETFNDKNKYYKQKCFSLS